MEAWRKELYLAHHGILGQKWGVRRYQNEDGSLTPAGKSRYLKYKSGKMKEPYGIDEKAYKKWIDKDMTENPNNYGRLTEEQKKKYDYAAQVERVKFLTKFEKDMYYDDATWTKYASEAANHLYDDLIKQYGKDETERWYGTRDEYVGAEVQYDRESRDDFNEILSTVYARDKELKAKIQEGVDWYLRVSSGVNNQNINSFTLVDQIMEDVPDYGGFDTAKEYRKRDEE